jgi:photoactive yellow protein
MTTSYDAPHLAKAVEELPPGAIDALPFGAIRLNAQGVVTFYSEGERRLAGFARQAPLGDDFFASIAPCMDNPEYRGRIEQALAAGHLDLRFYHTGDFSDRTRELEVRVQPATGGGYWIFMRRG